MTVFSTHRIVFITAFTFFLFLTTPLSAGLSRSLTLFIPHIISAFFWFLYIPAALFLPCVRRKKGLTTSWDRAWGELAWVGAQFLFWIASFACSIAQRVDYTCTTQRDYGYSVETVWLQWNGVVDRIPRYCDTMIAIAVLSGIQLVILTMWAILLVTVVSKGKGTGRGGWGTGVDELLHGKPGWRSEDEEGLRKAPSKV
ncbi:hypothetical protein IAT38_003539 [Cryptococcus sp. DSM 104549]